MSIGTQWRAWRTRGERSRLEAALADALKCGSPESVALAERFVALVVQAFGAEHPEVGVARYTLGAALLAAGDAEGALREGRAASVLLGPEAVAPSPIDVLQLVASAASRGDDADATVASLRALAAAIEASPTGESRDLRLAEVDTRLGLALAKKGSADDAWSHLSRALVLRRARLGARDLAVGESLFNLATHRIASASTDEAAARFEEATRIAEACGDRGASLREAALQNLGGLREEQGRDDDARAAWEQALALRQGRLGMDHAELRPLLVRLGQLRERTGSPLVAGVLFGRAHDIARADLGDSHPITRALAEWKGSPTQ